MAEHLEVLALADDLVGALEAGGALARAGLRVAVTTETTLGPAELAPDTTALVIDTETRSLQPSRAAERLRGLVDEARRRGLRWVHKHTDPTFRGNIAAELCVVAETFHRSLVYAPACASRGIACREGELHLDGHPLSQARFAGDPLEAGDERSLPALLSAKCSAPATALPHPDDLARVLSSVAEPTLLVCDGETPEDVQQTAEAVRKTAPPYLTAGSAAFAGALAERLGLPRGEPLECPAVRRALLICGSLDASAHRELQAAGLDGWAAVDAEPETLLVTGPYAEEVREELTEHLTDKLAQSNYVLLTLLDAGEDPTDAIERAEALGVTDEDRYLQLAEGLGEVVRAVDEHQPLDALGIFGEDTLRGILRALGRPLLRPLGEIHVGLPVCLIDRGGRDLLLIAKAGELALAQNLEDIRRYLQ